MAKTVVIVGSLDTKGAEFAFVKEIIEKEGLATQVVHFGVMGAPGIEPDVGEKPWPKRGTVIWLIWHPATTKTRPCRSWPRDWPLWCGGCTMTVSWTASLAWAAPAARPLPFDEPENVGTALATMPGVGGFFGESSIERLPTERAITGQVESFKALKLAS